MSKKNLLAATGTASPAESPTKRSDYVDQERHYEVQKELEELQREYTRTSNALEKSKVTVPQDAKCPHCEKNYHGPTRRDYDKP